MLGEALSLGSGALSVATPWLEAQGQKDAARAARRQINLGMGENRVQSEGMRGEQTNLQTPWVNSGINALGDLESFRMREVDPYQASQFGGVNMGQDPGLAFRMKSGVNALDASAANKGTLFSGPQQKALLEFGQNLGSEEFSNAYGRQYGQFMDKEAASRDQFNRDRGYTSDLDQYRMNQLGNVAGMGQGATNQLAGSLANIGSSELANQMMLRGAKGDVNASIAQAPWKAGTASLNNLGGMGSEWGQYYMNK